VGEIREVLPFYYVALAPVLVELAWADSAGSGSVPRELVYSMLTGVEQAQVESEAKQVVPVWAEVAELESTQIWLIWSLPAGSERAQS
jgi:hypothetical protein